MNQYSKNRLVCFFKKIGLCRVVPTTVILMLAFDLSAQQVSPQMIEQFQSLPRSQQEALARQYGVDIGSMVALQSQSSSQSNVGQPGELLQPVYNNAQSQNQTDPYTEFLLERQIQFDEESEESKRYGMDLFDAEVTTFSPVDDALVPSEYRLGPGDSLVVQLFGKENEQYSLEISRSGEINFPRFGPISVAGISFDDAEALIQQRVSEQLIGVQAVVSMGRLRAISVFMVGEVKRPGSYAVSALTTVTQALFVSGGVSDIGSLRNIEVKRAGETVGIFDVYDLLLKGDASNDLRLQSGDVVFVPPYNSLAEIEGAVRRPMIYELDGTETVADVVDMAGGFETSAHRASVVLERAQGSGALQELKNLDLDEASDLAITMRDGDLLRVPIAADYVDNKITLEGAVIRPGNYAWYEGIRVSDLIRSVNSDLLQEVDLGYALIIRQKNARRDIEVHQFDLGAAIFNKGSESDLLLSKQDRILIFGLAEEEVFADEQAEEEERQRLEVEERLMALGLASEQIDADRKKIEEEQEVEEEKLSFRRQDLLEPVLGKLRTQAREGEPVQIVSVSGAVKVPGEYPLKQGDKLFDLVRAAGGLHDSAYLEGAEFRRVIELAGGIQSQFLEVPLIGVGNASSVNNIELQSRDHLTVRQVPDWSPNRTITLAGEVRFPGTYLFGKGETLGGVLERAGGLTQDGFAAGATFTREIIREREAAQAKYYADQVISSYAAATLTREEVRSDYLEIEQISTKLESYEGIGRMVIDLESILAGEEAADVALLDGDVLLIPERNNSIAVIGEVLRSATHSYQSDFDVEDYLELSAGMTKRADDNNIYIVKANGAVVMSGGESWLKFSSREGRLEPGDTIVVPINSEYKDRWSFWTDVTQILYQGGIAIAAVIAI